MELILSLNKLALLLLTQPRRLFALFAARALLAHTQLAVHKRNLKSKEIKAQFVFLTK